MCIVSDVCQCCHFSRTHQWRNGREQSTKKSIIEEPRERESSTARAESSNKFFKWQPNSSKSIGCVCAVLASLSRMQSIAQDANYLRGWAVLLTCLDPFKARKKWAWKFLSLSLCRARFPPSVQSFFGICVAPPTLFQQLLKKNTCKSSKASGQDLLPFYTGIYHPPLPSIKSTFDSRNEK